MPINSSPGIAEEDHEPEWLGDILGEWLDDIFNDAYFSPGGRQDVGGSNWFGVSVGLANIPFLGRPGAIVPPLVSVPTITPQISLPESTHVADVIPIQVGAPVSWREFLAAGGTLPADWNQYPHASDHPSVGGAPAEGQVISEEPMSILGDIYDWVDENVAGGYLPGGYVTPVGGLPPAVYQPVNYNPGSGVAPIAPGPMPLPGAVMPTTADCGPVMIFNSKTGKWSKKRKRRRRQLATRSDIRDLSALKGVLGLGKNLEVWIATHS